MPETTRAVSAGEVIFLRPRDIERIEIDGRSLDDARYKREPSRFRSAQTGLIAASMSDVANVCALIATGTIYAGRTRINGRLNTTDLMRRTAGC